MSRRAVSCRGLHVQPFGPIVVESGYDNPPPMSLVTTTPTFSRGTPVKLFDVSTTSIPPHAFPWNVTRDGKRFIAIKNEVPAAAPAAGADRSEFVFIVNFAAELRAKSGECDVAHPRHPHRQLKDCDEASGTLTHAVEVLATALSVALAAHDSRGRAPALRHLF